MSSLAAARADNFYFPPEWTPQMGGISKFQGSKGANQYEQKGIIRFELPFDGWCLGCGTHMTKGLRFNAKKEKEGKYFTTQIWSFHMKCFSTSCDQKYKILTDPKNCTYDFAEGIRKHEQDFVPDIDDSLIVATSDETKHLIASDPMFRLQHNEEDRKRVLSDKEHIEALTELQDEHHKNDYDMNSLLRNKNRKRKRRDIELLSEGNARGLSIPLVEPSAEDSAQAKLVSFKRRAIHNGFALGEKQRMNNIQSQSIFERPVLSSSKPSKDGTSTQLVVRTTAGSATAATIGQSASEYAKTAALLSKASALRIDARHLKLSSQVPPGGGFTSVPSSSRPGALSASSSQAGVERHGEAAVAAAAPSLVVHKKAVVSGGPAPVVISGLMGMLAGYEDDDDE